MGPILTFRLCHILLPGGRQRREDFNVISRVSDAYVLRGVMTFYMFEGPEQLYCRAFFVIAEIFS